MKVFHSHKKLLLGIASLSSVALIWEIMGRIGMINPLFFSWPSAIGKELLKIVSSGELLKHFSVSFFELFWGFSLACLAIPIGILMGRSETVEYVFDPIFSAISAVPRVALMPLVILLFGIGPRSKIFLIFFGCFFPILINVFQGTKNIDKLTIDMGKIFGANGIKQFQHILLPSIVPYLIAGFQIAVSVGLIMVVVGEFFVGSEGIGFKIAEEGSLYHASALMAWVLVISAFSIFLTELIKYFEKRTRGIWFGKA